MKHGKAISISLTFCIIILELLFFFLASVIIWKLSETIC